MKAQASLEFLSTYGWAFLIIILMIAALSYFGISEPDLLLSENCAFDDDLLCDDFLVTQDTVGEDEVGVVLVSLRQNVGRSIFIQDITCHDAFDSDSLGYVHFPNDENGDTTKGFNTLPKDDILRQWDPAERITLKCHLSNLGESPFVDRSGDAVRLSILLTVKKRFDGFNHEYEGEVVARVQ